MLIITQEELTSAHSVSCLLQLETISKACVEDQLCSFWLVPVIELRVVGLLWIMEFVFFVISVEVVLVDFFLCVCLRLDNLLLVHHSEALFIHLHY